MQCKLYFVDDLSTKISHKKAVYVKVFNMIRNRNEAKAIVKHISCDLKCTFNIIMCYSNQKCNNEHVNVSVDI